MLIPLRHENMEGRRWPVISIALIAINFVVFLGTHWQIDAQNPKRAEERGHILMLAPAHPELHMNSDVQEFVTTFPETNPPARNRAAWPTRQCPDACHAATRMMTAVADL